MKKQQEEYDHMMSERMSTVDAVPAENAQPDVANLSVNLSDELTKNTVMVDQSLDAVEPIAEPIAQESAVEPLKEMA